jgi:RND family efflux transporter MFP subunit
VGKKIVIIVTVAVVGLLGWLAYRKASVLVRKPDNRRQAFAVAVEVVPLQKGSIDDVGLFTGSLVPKSYVIVAPKVAGRLEKLFVGIGDVVKRGQPIAVLDDEEYAQQVEQARAEREVAKANVLESESSLEVAGREYKRVEALRQKRIASESELDTARASHEAQGAKHQVALAQVAQREAALEAAKVRLSYTRINASWEDGEERRVVGERFVHEGAMLKANDPIVSILDIHSLTAVIHIIERDYSKVSPGQKAVITTDAFPDRTFFGTILRIAPLLKETSREARVEIEIPNPDGILKPGMFVRVRIQFARHSDVTLVPVSALVKRNGQTGVFLADPEEMKARFVPVELGIVNGELAEVIRPPLSGWVVTLGHHLLEDGSAIILPTVQSGSVPSRCVHPVSSASHGRAEPRRRG